MLGASAAALRPVRWSIFRTQLPLRMRAIVASFRWNAGYS
jgi:hypothetical protein